MKANTIPNERYRPPPTTEDAKQHLIHLSNAVKYDGNPDHKKNPGDFDLTPPSRPRSDKSLCDSVNIFEKKVAMSLLKEGIRRGLISPIIKKWPQNVWAVTDKGEALEAQLGNIEQGIYHGYPMPPNDPMREEIIKTWKTYGNYI